VTRACLEQEEEEDEEEEEQEENDEIGAFGNGRWRW